MSEPLGEARLAEIGRRHATTTGGHWRFDPDGLLGPSTVVSESGGYEHMVGSLDFGEGLHADHDRDFVMNARADMADLLVDNAHLRRVILRLTGGADAGVQRVRLHKTEAGVWRVRWKQDGRPKAKTLPSEAEAQEWAKRLKGGDQ